MAIIDKPSDYFNTVLYTGTESSGKTVTGVGFQPDWIWIKNRTDASNHNLYDSVRGGNGTSHYWLKSNSNVAEGTNTSSLLTIDSDGFTLGDGNEVNGSSDNIASWNWKAGTSVSGDTTGSGTLKTYTGSVNTTSGFSIIKYTGNGTAGHTIPHHLGVAPSAIFVKKLNELGDWSSYHSVLGNAGYMRLNNTNAFATASTYWNNTSPTSSVFTTGTTGNINGSGSTYIAYCFAEKQGYSKFGSYTGNGNADGTFVYTGFKPAFVFVKRTNDTENWTIMDNTRDPFNVAGNKLHPNTSGGTDAGATIDILSNGFKNRTTNAGANGSGDSYIYMAIAENPFVTSTANGSIPATAR